jgi:hypothetical protein
MAIKEREYLMSVDSFKTPKVLKNQDAISMLLLRLILLEPGSDPLHPDMGVGIVKYRYGMNTLEELKKRVESQIATYLPCFPAASVNLEVTGDHLCNIYITVNDTVYKYDSSEAPVPITIDSVIE